eukprot:Gb_10377 [translate_table: standard]
MGVLAALTCLLAVMLLINNAVAPNSTASQEPASETRAMLRLKRSLQIPSTAWPDGIRPCDWRGIKCQHLQVTSIDLSGLPTSSSPRNSTVSPWHPLRKLQFLRNLNTSGFALPGVIIPKWIGILTTLESLDCGNSSLEGQLPKSIANLGNLRTLRLAYNNLSGQIPPPIGRMYNLSSIDLSYNYFTGIFPEFTSTMSNLKSLKLSGNNFHGQIPSTVGKLFNLEHLSVGNNQLGGKIPSELWSLKNLTHLDLCRNSLSGSLSSIGNLSKLVFLNLERNNITGSIPMEVSECSMLQVLKLDHNLLEGELPHSIGTLKNLQIMSLAVNSLSGFLPRELTSLQKLKLLDLSFNQFYGPLPSRVGDMKSLLRLDVSNNLLNGSVPLSLLRIAKVARNCFNGVSKQHSERSCRFFYTRKGLPPQSILPSTPPGDDDTTERMSWSKRGTNLAAILGGAIGGIVLILMIGGLVFCIQRRQRINSNANVDKLSEGDKGEDQTVGGGGSVVNMSRLGESFSYAQLVEATEKFSPVSLLKVGHTGDLHRGVLEGGAAVVVKRIELSRVKKGLYIQELELFGKASHTRLVPLLGHCLGVKEEKLLVYKYMPNGDLESLMRKKIGPQSKDCFVHPLDWISRLKIVIGIAEGLVYLHHECSPPIIHRDIKASSILLDEKFEVRLGSLSAACNQDGESHPGLIARLLNISQSWDQGESGSAVATRASDVYSFGKVLLEIISGNIGISEGSENRGESSWIDSALPLIDIHDKDTLPRIVDPYLIVDEDLLEEVWAVAVIAKACLNPKPSKRPTMRHVLRALENPCKVVRYDLLNESGVRTSSRSSWNEAFGSWQSSSASQHQQQIVMPGTLREEYLSSGTSRGRSSRRAQVRPGSNDIVSDHTQEG